jgi:hypothetical protein
MELSFEDDQQYSEQDYKHGAEQVEEQAEPQGDAQQVEEGIRNLAARRRDQAPHGALGASCNYVTAAKSGCRRHAQSCCGPGHSSKGSTRGTS